MSPPDAPRSPAAWNATLTLFFELKAGEALEYEYTYDESKFVVKGRFRLTDMKTGEQSIADAGEILFSPKGTPVKVETDAYALGYFTGDRDFAA